MWDQYEKLISVSKHVRYYQKSFCCSLCSLPERCISFSSCPGHQLSVTLAAYIRLLLWNNWLVQPLDYPTVNHQNLFRLLWIYVNRILIWSRWSCWLYYDGNSLAEFVLFNSYGYINRVIDKTIFDSKRSFKRRFVINIF